LTAVTSSTPRANLTVMSDTPARGSLDELLDYQGFADEWTKLRDRKLAREGKPTPARPVLVETVRSYAARGRLPVPAEQIGGRKPANGEKLKAWGQPGDVRDPRPGERVRVRLKRWTRRQVRDWFKTLPGAGGAPRTPRPRRPWSDADMNLVRDSTIPVDQVARQLGRAYDTVLRKRHTELGKLTDGEPLE
jgi:hypothetical protein